MKRFLLCLSLLSIGVTGMLAQSECLPQNYSIILDDGMFLLHVSVTAEAIDTDDLDTAMLIEGKVEYVGESAGA